MRNVHKRAFRICLYLLKSFFKRANTYINTLDNWVNEAANTLNALGEKLTINKEKRHNHIKELVGEE